MAFTETGQKLLKGWKWLFLCTRQASPRHVCTCGPSALVPIWLFAENWPKITCSCRVYRLLIKCACRQSGPATGCKVAASLYHRLRWKGLADLVNSNTGLAGWEAHSPSYWRQILKLLYIFNVITHYMSLFLHCVYVTNWDESDVSVQEWAQPFLS